MKLSNFKLISTEGSRVLDKVFIATVDVETGKLWWKKKRQMKIRRESYDGSWYFVETGEFTPDRQAENLARAWTANTEQET